ncbi:MAG TPA: EAL domain-containing protein, partial [Erysipelotrichaceae bacterium]|nr:EAL domain-containing protein [Erysipelotrichaceae bacterium]
SELVSSNKELAYQQGEKADRASELVTANKELAYQQGEKADRASELVTANIELAYQQGEKADRASELVTANIELAYQQGEKADRASELVSSNKELAYQQGEKADRASEFIKASKELLYQQGEKAERASELATANIELAYQQSEKADRASELVTANKELAYQQGEKADRASELVTANIELAYQQSEKADRASELVTANKELAYQQSEKADRASELVTANIELAYQQKEKAARAKELSVIIDELENQIALRKKSIEKSKQSIYNDSLTGLPNQLMLVDWLKQAINLANWVEKPIGIFLMDIDDFKVVNNTLGHNQGDELLKAVAKRLLKLVQEGNIVARIGGDEFVIMSQNFESKEDIIEFSNAIMDAIRQPFELNNNEIYMNVSIGISIFPVDGETYETIIKNAEIAMYKAKQMGKNQSVLCSTIMKDNITENMKLSNGLYQSLERNELEVYYQPQISLSTKKIVGLEALLRWNHPELGFVEPGKFILLAEQTGLINPIGKWVMNTVCSQNKAWQDANLTPTRIAVNLSISQFKNLEIINQIKEILEETKLLPQYLEFEITESIAMNDTELIISVLNDLQKLGIYISIDDFGTEFSSLQYLKLLPINKIKIPMPFIQGINKDKKDEAIIETIIILAKRLGLNVIAEGVETIQQEAFLAERKCDEIQGFYYYKPMPARDIEVLLQANN